jgi:hypothetical protein
MLPPANLITPSFLPSKESPAKVLLRGNTCPVFIHCLTQTETHSFPPWPLPCQCRRVNRFIAIPQMPTGAHITHSSVYHLTRFWFACNMTPIPRLWSHGMGYQLGPRQGLHPSCQQSFQIIGHTRAPQRLVILVTTFWCCGGWSLLESTSDGSPPELVELHIVTASPTVVPALPGEPH